ncbi:hypothetical protein HKBW3S25_01198, partial [Candidatus Hakubella thermalkaliphila]
AYQKGVWELEGRWKGGGNEKMLVMSQG